MESTRQRMVTTAAHLIRAQGLHATGLNQVLTESHAPRGSLYHHFPGGKEQLALEALHEYGETVRSLLAHCLTKPTIVAAVDAFAAALATQLSRSDYRDGCPIGAVAMEAAGESRAMAEATAAVFATWTDALQARLHADGVEDARGLAVTVVAAMEGAVMLARAQRSTEPLRIVTRTLCRLLDR